MDILFLSARKKGRKNIYVGKNKTGPSMRASSSPAQKGGGGEGPVLFSTAWGRGKKKKKVVSKGVSQRILFSTSGGGKGSDNPFTSLSKRGEKGRTKKKLGKRSKSAFYQLDLRREIKGKQHNQLLSTASRKGGRKDSERERIVIDSREQLREKGEKTREG